MTFRRFGGDVDVVGSEVDHVDDIGECVDIKAVCSSNLWLLTFSDSALL